MIDFFVGCHDELRNALDKIVSYFSVFFGIKWYLIAVVGMPGMRCHLAHYNSPMRMQVNQPSNPALMFEPG